MLAWLSLGLLAAAPEGVPAVSIMYCDSSGRWEAQSWRELPADAPRHSRDGDEAVITIDSFGGLPVHLTLRGQTHGDETTWTMRLVNGAGGNVVGVRGPAISGVEPRPGGALYLPNRAGHRVPEPWSALAERVASIVYPVPASMQFVTYAGPTGGVAYHVLDRDMVYKAFEYGGPERMIRVLQYPFCEPGQEWESPPIVWQTLRGDWHAAADRYRAWFERWAPEPATSPLLRRFPIFGGTTVLARPVDDEHLRDVLKAQEVGTYAAALEQMRQLKAAGYEGSHLVGWFGLGHDTTYPDYDPSPAMGGADGLRALIDGMHQLGMMPTVYLNARLANVTNPTYVAHPEWRCDQEGDQLWTEGYGDQTFHVLCPACRPWQEHLTEQVRRTARFGADGAQLDQIGAASTMLCFHPDHGHRTPATAWGEGYPAMLATIRDAARAIRPDYWLWIEGAWEGAGCYVDASQGGFWPDLPGAQAFGELYRYALPRHRMFGDALTGGIPFWCPTDIHRAKRIDDAASEVFWDGTFHDDKGLHTVPSAKAKWFEHQGEVVLCVRNLSAEPQLVEVAMDPAVIGHATPPPFTEALALGATIPTWTAGPWLRCGVPVPGGQVEAVRMRW